MPDPNAAAFVQALLSSVVRCHRCECALGMQGGPIDKYVINLLGGKTYCEECADILERNPA